MVLVTGGNGGIGVATAKRFVDEGAYVFITGRREAELAATVKEIGRNVTVVPGDVSNLVGLDLRADHAGKGEARRCLRECRCGEVCPHWDNHRRIV